MASLASVDNLDSPMSIDLVTKESLPERLYSSQGTICHLYTTNNPTGAFSHRFMAKAPFSA